MKKISLLPFFFLAAITSCTGSSNGSGEAHKPEIVVAIEPQLSLVRAIAGDKANVSALLSSGADPETYDPTITALATLSRADGYFRLGTMPFEDQLIGRLGSSMPTVYDSSEGVELIAGSHAGEQDHDHEPHHHDDVHNHETDPHIWSSIVNGRIMARNYMEALCKIDPANSGYYKERYDSVDHRLDSINQLFARRLEGKAGATFMVWHPSLSYFARDYGLRQIAISSETKETTLKGLQQTIDNAIERGVTLFFNQPGYDPRLSATVRAHVGARCIEVDPLAYDWIEQLDKAVDSF